MTGPGDGTSRDQTFFHRLHVPVDPGPEIFVLLHGSGADEESLVPMARQIDPRATLLAVRGRVVQAGERRWFRKLTPVCFDQQSVSAEAEAFAAFLRDMARRLELDPAHVVFIGYSNGANLVASVMQLMPGTIRRAALLRAMPVLDARPRTRLEGSEILILGGRDDLTYGRFAPPLARRLAKAGGRVTLHQVAHGHGLGADDARLMRAWLDETSRNANTMAAEARAVGSWNTAGSTAGDMSQPRFPLRGGHINLRQSSIHRSGFSVEIAIIVEFEAMEGREAELASVLEEHARRTLEEEPGCLRFEVLQQLDPDGAPIINRFIVNELYSSRLAVKAHEDNPRLERVRAAVAPLLKSRRLLMAQMHEVSRPPQEGIRPEDLSAANDD